MSKLTREEVIARIADGDYLQWDDLSQLDLSNTNLANAKMKGTNLGRTNLTELTLSYNMISDIRPLSHSND